MSPSISRYRVLSTFGSLRPRLLLAPNSRSLHISSSLSSEKTSSSSDLKPIILEQPDKFRPPSHPQRLGRRKRVYYGRSTSPEEKKELDSKQYPYSFPPQESFMHWFLTTRWIHVWISMSVLVSLSLFMFISNFNRKNRFPELVPPGSLLFTHPLRYLSECIHVYRLHTAAVSQDVQALRDREVEDVQKRRAFRREHGLPELTGVPAWLGLGTLEEEQRVKEVEERARSQGEVASSNASVSASATAAASTAAAATTTPPPVVGDSMGNMTAEPERPGRRKVKRWFGIWE